MSFIQLFNFLRRIRLTGVILDSNAIHAVWRWAYHAAKQMDTDSKLRDRPWGEHTRIELHAVLASDASTFINYPSVTGASQRLCCTSCCQSCRPRSHRSRSAIAENLMLYGMLHKRHSSIFYRTSAPPYLWTLWHYTNAVIMMIIISTRVIADWSSTLREKGVLHFSLL